MKNFFSIILLALSQYASADLLSPSGTVEAVIRHAQKGQLVAVNIKEATQGEELAGARDELLKLLKGIDPEKLVFEAKDKKHRIFWFVDPLNQNKSQVRLLEPKKLIFEVSFVHDPTNGCVGYSEITSIREAAQDAESRQPAKK